MKKLKGKSEGVLKTEKKIKAEIENTHKWRDEKRFTEDIYMSDMSDTRLATIYFLQWNLPKTNFNKGDRHHMLLWSNIIFSNRFAQRSFNK